MLSIVCWLWAGFRDFSPAHVNCLARMIRRQLRVPHRFICITDRSDGLAPDVEFFRTPDGALELAQLKTPEGPAFPSCYRRLWIFSEAARVLGDTVVSIDIDLIATGDVTPLFERDEDFIGWRPLKKWGNANRFNGGMFLLRTGSRTSVFDSFHGQESIATARRAGFRGSDQAWISYCLGSREIAWPENCGIYSIRDLNDGRLALPADARIVQFNGPQKPWNTNLAWARQHWI